MTKSTFTAKTDNKTGLKYFIKAKDELTKNHRESDKELISGVLPESPGGWILIKNESIKKWDIIRESKRTNRIIKP